MNGPRLKRQRSIFFLSTMISFAIIFVVLGVIVFRLVESSMYETVDSKLKHFASDSSLIEAQANQTEKEFKPPERNNSLPRDTGPNSIQQQIVLWNADGEIVNNDDLGARQNDLAELTLDEEQLDQIVSLSLPDRYDRTLQFHSITFKAEGLENEEVAYIQVMTNTDQIVSTVQNFRQILIACMGVFALLSILLSYFLSRRFSQPILVSWKKQQQFVENASHELRTPLTIIQAKLEGLFTKPMHTIVDESESIALALNEVQRLNKLTSDLLTLARSDGNSIEMNRQPVNVNQLLEKITLPYSEVAETEGKKLRLELSNTQQALIDAEKIHQLLVILLDNALKYTKSGEEIVIRSGIKNHEWSFSVADTGKGIDDKNKKQVFERFYREDSSRNRQTGGNGIGLSIAQWIVAVHKGKIYVKDNQPKGVIFEVVLPLK